MSERTMTPPGGAAVLVPSTVADFIERERVLGCLTELFLATDRKDWPVVASVFAPRVRFDMSSVGGAPEALVRSTEIVAGWRDGLAAVEHVHHQVGNFQVRVNATVADAFCYGIAYHHRARKDGRNTRVFVGSYDFELEHSESGDWRITAMRFNLKFVDGNPTLEAPE